MNGQDGYLDDLEKDPDTEMESAKEGAEETVVTPEKPKDEEWKTAYETLKTQIEEQNLRVLATLGQIAQPKQQQQVEQPKQTPALTAEQWAVAKTMPELIPHLVKNDLAQDFDNRMEKFEQRLYQTLGRQNATQSLGRVIKDYYAEEIQDPKSEIMGLAPDVKRMLEPFLRPEVIGSDNHDQLALLLAASMKPQSVAKREVARSQAREQARSEAAGRSSAMTEGTGRSRSQEPTITEDHRAIARRLGINLNDEKTKARLLGYMKTERLTSLGTRDLGTEG